MVGRSVLNKQNQSLGKIVGDDDSDWLLDTDISIPKNQIGKKFQLASQPKSLIGRSVLNKQNQSLGKIVSGDDSDWLLDTGISISKDQIGKKFKLVSEQPATFFANTPEEAAKLLAAQRKSGNGDVNIQLCNNN